MTTQRQVQLENIKRQRFDLLVIGGGITGAGIALDAAARGLKVALVEKGDFASGTSSKSTKLIHGGLRYLKQFELGVVREVGKERKVVHKLAPHLVKPEKMLLPIYHGGTFGKLGTSLGLWLYDFLAGVKGADRRKILSANCTKTEEPLLRNDGLLGGGLYAEYRTDDARLTIEVVKTAIRHGATCLNYVKAMDFLLENEHVDGAVCIDQVTGEIFEVNATAVVNAAGPWVDNLRKLDKSLSGKRIFLSKGSHIVVARERLPLRQAVYFDVADGRMVFAIPRNRATYIGTTDLAFSGDTNHVFASMEEVEYLLHAANALFSSVNLTVADVESTWAGLRPLIYEEGKKTGEMSRKDEVFVSGSGLISVAGGKLTGYRKMAQKVVRRTIKRHGFIGKKCQTATLPLTEKPFGNSAEVIDFQRFIEVKISSMADAGYLATYLVENYGRAADTIVDRAFSEGSITSESIVGAELEHCLTHEMLVKPADFLERRTGRLYFDIQSVETHLDFVLAVFKKQFNWTDSVLSKEREDMLLLLKNARSLSA